MEYSFLEIAIAYVFGITMPGPTIALVVKNALICSRKTAIISCLGIMIGIGLQSGVVLTGLILFEAYPLFIKILKLLSSLYLIYLGLKIFFNPTWKLEVKSLAFYYKISQNLLQKLLPIYLTLERIFLYSMGSACKIFIIKKFSHSFTKHSLYSYFIEGLLLELLNPLAFSFFVSIMSIMIDSKDSWNIKFLYWLEIVIIGLLWFCGVAIFCSSKIVNKHLKYAGQSVKILTGVVFLFFGIKLFFD